MNSFLLDLSEVEDYLFTLFKFCHGRAIAKGNDIRCPTWNYMENRVELSLGLTPVAFAVLAQEHIPESQKLI